MATDSSSGDQADQPGFVQLTPQEQLKELRREYRRYRKRIKQAKCLREAQVFEHCAKAMRLLIQANKILAKEPKSDA